MAPDLGPNKVDASDGVPESRSVTARERIEQTAYDLFSRRGVRAVGIDEVVARSCVAKMTLYRHYPSKNHLVLAFLRRREELWTRGWLQTEVERRGGSAARQLLAIFEVFDKWFRRTDFEGCSFINVLLEIEEKNHPLHLATVAHLATIRVFIRQLTSQAGARDPDGLARQWHILMKGAIIAAGEGDVDAALRARAIGCLLLSSEDLGVAATEEFGATASEVLGGAATEKGGSRGVRSARKASASLRVKGKARGGKGR